MLIAISSSGKDINAPVDAHFGRCPYFVYVDPDTMTVEAEANSGLQASGGAGIAAAQQITDKKATAVLTGSCGPNAFNVLNAAGVEVYAGASGTVADAVKQYRDGSLQAMSSPNATSHSGMGGGR